MKQQNVDALGVKKECKCDNLLREIARENLELRREVEEQRELIMRLKKWRKKYQEELRKMDRKEVVYAVVCVLSILFALCAIIVRFKLV